MIQPDIEIYVNSASVEEITNWLKDRMDSFEADQPNTAKSHSYKATLGDETIPVLIVEKAAGKYFTSVWFDSNKTPWEKDVDCGRDAFQFMEKEIRCNAAGWLPGDEPDEWLCINSEGEEKIV